MSAASDSQSPSNDPSTPPDWWQGLNRNYIRGPSQQDEKEEMPYAEAILGADGYKLWSSIVRKERQRVWDAMRASAQERYERGEMPDWFDPEWLTMEEAPVNQMLREEGWDNYQYDDTWLAGGDGGNGSRGHGGGKGWWREDDPYWPLRDWGDHPMRWWTFAFAACLAVGGLFTYLRHGTLDSLWLGSLVSAALCVCAMGMSDAKDDVIGPMSVKAAFGMAIKELASGWAHQRGRPQSQPGLSSIACAAMCVLYMWTGMGGLDEVSLPANPGSVYKSQNVLEKHRVWERWGYGDVPMRM